MPEVSWRRLRDELSRTTGRDWAHAIAAVAGLLVFLTIGAVLGRVFDDLIEQAWHLAGLSAVVVWSRRRRR